MRGLPFPKQGAAARPAGATDHASGQSLLAPQRDQLNVLAFWWAWNGVGKTTPWSSWPTWAVRSGLQLLIGARTLSARPRCKQVTVWEER